MAVLVMCILPVMNMFGTSGRAVQKSQNLGFAVGLAHRISQHLFTKPFTEINSISLPGNSITDGPDDGFFNPMENFTANSAGALRVTKAQMPDLYNFLQKFDFRFSLIVNNVSFGTGDEMKTVGVVITWKEGGQNLLYRMQVNVPRI